MREPLKLKSLINSSLLDRLNALLEQNVIDEVELLRLEKAADKVADKNLAYTLLGALSAIKFDATNVYKNFNAALRYSTSSENHLYTQSNQAVALQRIYKFKESAQLIYQVHDNYRDNLGILDTATSLCTAALQFHKLKELNIRSDKLGHDNHIAGVKLVKKVNDNSTQTSDSRSKITDKSKKSDTKNCSNIVELLDRHKITEDELGDRVDAAAQVLFENKIPFRGYNLLALDNGEFMYRFYLDVSPEKAAELNFQIADKLIDSFDNTLFNIFTISCTPNVN